MSLLAQLVIALAIFAAGAGGGIKWHAGQDAIAALAAKEAREADARQQRQFNDIAGGRHAQQLATLNSKLGDARAQLASLSGRTCLDADAVGLLNTTGVLERGAAAGQPASTASAPAAGASDRDVGEYIALCRTRYGEVTNQLNEILDIEARRHPPLPAPP